MYLKSIEIQGFKSFANRMVLEFHNGITGIVGPNGSGKSNVADAVRWVLGEQRIRQLRGASMQDVIFAGTQIRKPQGFAYVAITLDNSDHQLAIDYEQVTVSRRLYRSGESEYMINGSACRLRDINELFYDTGIGKEGYSIIGQGQIDKILSGKPEERRELFDEAAGIVKFKRRKAIAQKKLENERQNLLRVSDILAELEKQVGPLAKQSEAAKKYLMLKEELKTCEVNQFLIESEEIRGQIRDAEKKMTVVSGDMEEASAESERQKAEYDRLEQELAGLDAGINEKRTMLGRTEMLGGNLEGQINVLKEQINTERLRAEHMEERTRTLKREIEEKKERIASYEKDNAGITEAAREGRRKQQEAETRLNEDDARIRKLEQELEQAKSDVITGLNERASLTAREQRFEAMLEQVQMRRAEVSQRLLKIKSDESQLELQLEGERKKLANAREALTNLEAAQTVCEEELAGLEADGRRLSRNLGEKQKEYHTANTRLESLRNLAERYEGYGNSIRKVMETRDRVHGIRGVVADLVATDKKYETAIETALGGSIQNVVTDSEETARRLIEYLKKNRFGRVTFLPLTSIGQGGGFSRPEALREPGVLGLASDLVHTAPEYQVLAKYLLGRVVVADTIDHAIALARKYHYSLRIVTLEGELLSAGGSMTGGAFKNSSNLLGRRRELEELEAVCTKALHDVDRIQKEMAMQEAMQESKKEELELLRTNLHSASLIHNTLEVGVGQLEEKRNEIGESSKDLLLENGQLEQQITEIEDSRRGVQQDTLALEQQNEQINHSVEELMLRLESAKKLREESARGLESAKLEAANLNQKVDFVMENIRRVEGEAARLKEELDSLSVGSVDAG